MTESVPGDKDSVVGELRAIPGVSEKAAEALYALGIRSAKELEGKDPVAMYEELRNMPGSYAEPCLLNQLKVAVKAAKKDGGNRD
jgi:hypothetical protein